jgi:hypothetical protein
LVQLEVRESGSSDNRIAAASSADRGEDAAERPVTVERES